MECVPISFGRLNRRFTWLIVSRSLRFTRGRLSKGYVGLYSANLIVITIRMQTFIYRKNHNRSMEVKNIGMTKKEAYKLWDEWKKVNYSIYRSILRFCVHCGDVERLTVNHIDGDKTNNALSNLECLCWKCHMRFHQKEFCVRYISEVKTTDEYVRPVKKKRFTADELIKEYKWLNGAWQKR